MKTIICLALCILAVSALSPIENLSSALEVLDMQDLFDSHKGFDLSASFTYLGGVEGSDDGVDEQVIIQGTYNLLKFEDEGVKVESGTFSKTKSFTSHQVLNFTGSGSFNARGGGSNWEGYFNGGSSTDFAFEADAGDAYGIRKQKFSGNFKGKKSWGSGQIEVVAFQDVNASINTIDYNFQHKKDNEIYSGSSKASSQVYAENSEQYAVFSSSVFHGVNTKKSWQISGGYIVDVWNSKWENVYSKDGSFSKNGTSDEVLGTFSNLRSFGLPINNLVSE